MANPGQPVSLEEQIGQWRSYLLRRQTVHAVDVAELEDHLREQVTGLVNAGLAQDEAFLVAVKRMGNLDALSREFAREHSDRLWKQLVLVPPDSGEARTGGSSNAVTAFCLALGAALAVKVPVLFGINPDDNEGFYVRQVSFFVLPFLTAYFARTRRTAASTLGWIAAAFAVAAIFANVYPFVSQGSTEILTAIHLPIALWIAVGAVYAGGRWSQVAGRMDFIRFSGELFIYYVLIALGGIVFTGFTGTIFKAIGINASHFIGSWQVPCGAAAGVIIASWLVEAKQSVIENMAPVLTRLFTPLFAALMILFLGAVVLTGRGVNIERDMLIAFDLLLAVVLGLLLYAASARDPQAPPDAFDIAQVVLVVSALLVNAVALWAVAARITGFGFTPNRVAALGENVVLLVNLAWSAVLYVRFLRRRGSFTDLERWQTNYLPVYAVWAAIVVIVFPPLFRYT